MNPNSEENQNSLVVQTPAGNVSASGKLVVMILVFFAGMLTLGYILLHHDRENGRRMEAVIYHLRIGNCLLTLPQEKRLDAGMLRGCMVQHADSPAFGEAR